MNVIREMEFEVPLRCLGVHERDVLFRSTISAEQCCRGTLLKFLPPGHTHLTSKRYARPSRMPLVPRCAPTTVSSFTGIKGCSWPLFARAHGCGPLGICRSHPDRSLPRRCNPRLTTAAGGTCVSSRYTWASRIGWVSRERWLRVTSTFPLA